MHGGNTKDLSQVSDSLYLKEIRISFTSLELPPSSQTTATITKFLDLWISEMEEFFSSSLMLLNVSEKPLISEGPLLR